MCNGESLSLLPFSKLQGPLLFDISLSCTKLIMEHPPTLFYVAVLNGSYFSLLPRPVTTYRPVARIRITPVTLRGGVRKSRAGGPPLWRIVLTCDIRRHLGHLPGRVSAIEGVCRSVFGTVQHTVRHKRAEPSFVKKLAINTASVHFAIDKIRVILQAWALIIRILYVTLLMTSRAMGLLKH